MSKKKILLIALVLFSLFLASTCLVSLGIFTSLDRQITIFLQSVIGHNLDVPLSFFSLLASSEVTMIVLAIIAGGVYLHRKKVFYSLGLIFAVYFFELIGKIFIYHPGPPREFFRYDLPFVFPSTYVHTNYSFPSGHVSRTLFVIAILLFLTRKPKFYLLYFLLVILMIVSRVYLGEHWFSDVLGGTFLGSSLGVLTVFFL